MLAYPCVCVHILWYACPCLRTSGHACICLHISACMSSWSSQWGLTLSLHSCELHRRTSWGAAYQTLRYVTYQRGTFRSWLCASVGPVSDHQNVHTCHYSFSNALHPLAQCYSVPNHANQTGLAVASWLIASIFVDQANKAKESKEECTWPDSMQLCLRTQVQHNTSPDQNLLVHWKQ